MNNIFKKIAHEYLITIKYNFGYCFIDFLYYFPKLIIHLFFHTII